MFVRVAPFLPLFFASTALAQSAPPVSPSQPTCAAYIVIDLKSNRVLGAKNPDLRLFPASTTKMMTALVAAQRGNLNQIVVASPRAAGTGESGIGLLSGENHALGQLLRAVMIRSANDGSVAVAEGVAGSEASFVRLMNEKARALGLKNTRFQNPHGLHNPQHFTTARDLSQIGRAYCEVPFLNEIARERSATINGNWKIGPTRTFPNTNKLLLRWPLADGLKTGYTRQAGNCLVATATKTLPNGQRWRLLSVVLKSRRGHSFSDSRLILERAFSQYAPHQIARAGEDVWSGKIKGGAKILEAGAAKGIELPLRAGEIASLQREIEIFDIAAPVKRGQLVGRAHFSANGRRIASLGLQAREEVPETLLSRAAPAIGHSVSFWPTSWRIGFWGVLSGVFASVLLFFKLRKRRRKPFRAATLGRENLTKHSL